MKLNEMSEKIHVFTSPVFSIVIDEFFGKKINEEIFEHILDLKDHFRPATIGKDGKLDTKFRTNTVCYVDSLFFRQEFFFEDGTIDHEKRKKYRAENSPLLREVDQLSENSILKELLLSGQHPFHKFGELNTWDTQISRYGNDDQHYVWHQDRIDSDLRLLTFVYYANEVPKKFEGGELCLTNNLLYKGRIYGNGGTTEVKPENDRLVIFDSRVVHSVKPTKSSDIFSEGRFSVNIWAGIYS